MYGFLLFFAVFLEEVPYVLVVGGDGGWQIAVLVVAGGEVPEQVDEGEG